MILVSSSGGSGSSFLGKAFRKSGWKVCLRPDGGRQKANRTAVSIWMERTKPFFKCSKNMSGASDRKMFDVVYENLKNRKNTMLLSMTWGGMGLFNGLEKAYPVYLIRNPLHAFVSYSGGGWRSEGGARRIKYVGATSPNDKIWVDQFFGDFALWLNGAKQALIARSSGTGFIVRYHAFKKDWKVVCGRLGAPDITNKFSCSDSMDKVRRVLTVETIDYINNLVGNVWAEIDNDK